MSRSRVAFSTSGPSICVFEPPTSIGPEWFRSGHHKNKLTGLELRDGRSPCASDPSVSSVVKQLRLRPLKHPMYRLDQQRHHDGSN